MDRLEWIALAWHAQLGPAAFHRLIDRFGSPEVGPLTYSSRARGVLSRDVAVVR